MKALLLVTLLWITVSRSSQTVLIADNTMSKMIELSARKPYCTIHNDRGIIQRMLFNSDELRVRRMTNESVVKLEKICRNNQVLSPFQGGFIYPGTKWCGPGNIAQGYDDIGIHDAEDRCCREHDNCPNALARGECRQGICNDSPFTRSHCDCDAELRRCLQNVNTETANTIGAIFFNVIQVTCFKERRPCSQWQRNGYAQAESDILCAQMTYSPSEKYISLMPLPSK